MIQNSESIKVNIMERAHKGGISDTRHWPTFCIGHRHSNQNQCRPTPTLKIVRQTLDTQSVVWTFVRHTASRCRFSKMFHWGAILVPLFFQGSLYPSLLDCHHFVTEQHEWFLIKGAFIIYVTQGVGEFSRRQKKLHDPPSGTRENDVAPLEMF